MSVNVFTCRDVRGKAGIVAKIDRTALERALESVRDWKLKFDLLFGSCEERGRWIYVPFEYQIHSTKFNPIQSRRRILQIEDLKDANVRTHRLDDQTVPQFFAFAFSGRFPEHDDDIYVTKNYTQMNTVFRKVRVLTIRVRDGIDQGEIIYRKPTRKL